MSKYYRFFFSWINIFEMHYERKYDTGLNITKWKKNGHDTVDWWLTSTLSIMYDWKYDTGLN